MSDSEQALLQQFEEAIRAGDMEQVQSCLAAGAPLESPLPALGFRALGLAAAFGHADVVAALIAAGADVEAQDFHRPLHRSANVDVMRLLLDAGANVSSRGRDGNTALHCAAAGNFADMVSLLIERGADIDARNGHDETPLMVAVQSLSLNCVETLIAAGAQLDLQSEHGSTALMHAVLEDQRELLPIARALIKAGANVNIQRPDGQTALRYAVKYASLELVRTLVTAGADVNAIDDYNETALAAAIYNPERVRPSVVKCLLEAGADPNVRISERHPDPGRRGRTPRELAIEREAWSVVDVLDSFAK